MRIVPSVDMHGGFRATPDLAIPDDFLQANFDRGIDEGVEEAVGDQLVARIGDVETDVESAAFGVEGFGLGAGDVAVVVDAVVAGLRKVCVNELPEGFGGGLGAVPKILSGWFGMVRGCGHAPFMAIESPFCISGNLECGFVR